MDIKQYIEERNTERPVFMPYLTAGDPDLESTLHFGEAMFEAGADILELGIPFSDPTADGPVIEEAMVRSLRHMRFSMDLIFDVASRLHASHPDRPIVLLGYLNTILHTDMGGNPETERVLTHFLERCRKSGVAGVVIPDLPHDQPESILLRRLAVDYGVAQILMVAPNTGEKRLHEIAREARGFIYYVTSLGVTGERNELPEDLIEKIGRVRKLSGLPVLAGFGISKPEQAATLKKHVQGVIVGSLHHRIIQEHGKGSGSHLKKSTEGFIRALKS
jgi:tryptophan synthase alpha chain